MIHGIAPVTGQKLTSRRASTRKIADIQMLRTRSTVVHRVVVPQRQGAAPARGHPGQMLGVDGVGAHLRAGPEHLRIRRQALTEVLQVARGPLAKHPIQYGVIAVVGRTQAQFELRRPASDIVSDLRLALGEAGQRARHIIEQQGKTPRAGIGDALNPLAQAVAGTAMVGPVKRKRR